MRPYKYLADYADHRFLHAMLWQVFKLALYLHENFIEVAAVCSQGTKYSAVIAGKPLESSANLNVPVVELICFLPFSIQLKFYTSQKWCVNDNDGFLEIEEAIHKVKIRLDEPRA